MGDEGLPHGVLIDRVATGENPGSDSRPVPPITAILTGSEGLSETSVASLMYAHCHKL